MTTQSHFWERRVPLWTLWSLAAIVLYAGWAALGPPSTGREAASLLLVVTTRSAAALAALLVRRRLGSSDLSQAWDYWSIALALWALGDALRFADWIPDRTLASVPSLIDLLRLAGYLSAAAALTAFPGAPAQRFGRLRGTLDVLILGSAVFAAAWLTFVRSLVQIRVASPVEAYWAAGSPVLDVLLVSLALRQVLLRVGDEQTRLLLLVGLGALVLAATDLASGFVGLLGDARPGSWVDAGWMIASLAFVAACRRAGLLPADRPVSDSTHASRVEPLLAVIFTYTVVGLTLLDWRLTGEVDWLGVGASAWLAVLLVARQGVIAGQVELRQFETAVDTSLDMIFICDPEGIVHMANPALGRILPETTLPVVGTRRRGRRWLLNPGKDTRLEEFVVSEASLEELLQYGATEGWAGEVSFRRADGSRLPVALTLTPVQDERRRKPLLLGTGHDLTLVKEREQALQRALEDVAAARSDLEDLNRALEQKVDARTRELADTVDRLARLNEELRALDRLKSEFVALVSHELRAPLTNIRSGVELLLHSYDGLDGSARPSLELVLAETRRLGQFVETILDLSALEAGGFPLEVGPINLGEAMQSVQSRLPAEVRDRLSVGLPADLPAVTADERALGSVFFHLIDNAFKYAPEGPIRVEAEAELNRVLTRVSDCGPGIPPHERERVFEMFHRLDASDSREVYGHGLGLHLARRLLEGMGGGIRAEEAAGGGACFSFWLPRWGGGTHGGEGSPSSP